MSTNFAGNIVVGVWGWEIDIPEDLEDSYEDLFDWLCDYHDMEKFASYGEADDCDCVFGYFVKPVEDIDAMDASWIVEVQNLAEKFYQIVGVKPKLLGVVDVY